MAKPDKETLLRIYRANLEKYLREGNEPRIAVQRALIARIEGQK